MRKSRPHEEQLIRYRKTNDEVKCITTSNGVPIFNKNASLTVGRHGPMLMQDVVYMNEMAHFVRERIPERVVHAKGAGAHGVFTVTNDISKYCKASLFAEVGKQTDVFVRFSTVGGELGSADTLRDPRGFAIKFYTEDGNWDLVGNNTPVFFIRDPILFPSFIHTQKRNPVTHLKDANMVWDFFSLRPESTHQMMILFSDRGIPDGYRFMNGYGSHTFKLINNEGKQVYCKLHVKSAQGIRNLTTEEAKRLASEDPDYSIRDLYDSIEEGNFPKWNLMIQVMTFKEAERCKFNPFDVTKVWSHKDYPLIPVGQIVLNRNPTNYFAFTEQSAFSPSHVVPGINFSPDRMLQGRLFAYTDAHFHRLGPNYIQLPVNCPYRSQPQNCQRDGFMTFAVNEDGAPNYHPSSFSEIKQCPKTKEESWYIAGDVDRYDDGDDDNFTQPRDFWLNVLDDNARTRLVNNIADSLKECVLFVQNRTIKNLMQVHESFGNAVKERIKKLNISVQE